MPFEKGKSGNPGGRPKVSGEVKDLLAELGPAAIKKIGELMNTSKDERIQLDAAKALADRHYGKPAQSMSLKTPPGGLKVRMVRFTDAPAPAPASAPPP